MNLPIYTSSMKIIEKLQNCRQNKNCRLTIIGVFILIVVALLLFWWKAKIALWVILILLVSAFGIEYFDYDIDLGKLWETGSVSESRVEHKNGMKVFGTDCASNNLNCDDFKNQPKAQEKYDMCAEKIATDNNTTREIIRSIDIYGLDHDKDGIVCEALPRA